MSQTGPQVGGAGTHEQTLGELSNFVPATQATFWMHWHMPPQSAPPLFGSQLSLGSSTHLPKPGHWMPAMPPQNTLGASGTHAATGGQGALTHTTSLVTQSAPT